MTRNGAFTLLEMLAAMGIVLILAAAIYPFATNCIGRAKAAAEVAGARRSVAAWAAYAGENNNEVLPGYSMDPGARNAAGKPVSFPANARYVFRLAPYLNYELKGSLLVNDQKHITDDYHISMAPSFGLNITFVGGDFGGGSDMQPTDSNFTTYGKFVVTRLSEIHSPSKLVVLASARVTDSAGRVEEGYNAIKSPKFVADRWEQEYRESLPYYAFGNLHPRFDGKAVCAMADGHVELLSLEDLRDMRRWSNQAAIADDPDWTLQSL